MNEEWVEEPCRVKIEVKKYFERRFQEQIYGRPKLNEVEFPSLSNENTAMFTQDFEVEEIKKVIWDYESSKSLGLGGYSFLFIKTFWEVTKKEVVNFVKENHNPRHTNNLFIALIAKCENPLDLGQYHPISLVGCLYKIYKK